MKSASSILMYGRDNCLLQTRALVLQQAGYKVATIQQWSGAQAHKKVNLVVLCHTLTWQD
ncbi:MAG: hypothetical protein ACRYFU_02090 [Janthinobacterium lividum]